MLNQGVSGSISLSLGEYQESRSGMGPGPGVSGAPDIRESGPRATGYPLAATEGTSGISGISGITGRIRDGGIRLRLSP